MRVEGNLVDIHTQTIYPAQVDIQNDTIVAIEKSDTPYDTYILPGFVDAHIHIESSMLIPSEFARVAVNHGTVATVSDPHEIANILGVNLSLDIACRILGPPKIPPKAEDNVAPHIPATTNGENQAI